MPEAKANLQKSRSNSSDVATLVAEREDDKMQWPKSYRAYLVLFSGFLMQFNCWYILLQSRHTEISNGTVISVDD